MPDPELRDLVAAAQARSEAFMQSSRQQMFQSFQEQRAVGVGAPAGMRGATGVGGGADKPMAGTPAGRLMDAITGLVRRGAAFGAGAAGGVAQPVFAGGAAGVGAVAAGGVFLGGESPFGPAGIAGGTVTDMSRRMGFFQTAFAGYGRDLPFGLGRYAAQRADMEVHQARAMAQEDLRDRFVGGARRGGMAALNLLSFGMLNFGMRRAGLTLQYGRTEQFGRHIQNQLRFTTREALRGAGMEDVAGPFATGITREGADRFARPMARELGRIEAEMGLAPEELMTIQSRAVGTMGINRLNELVRKGPEAMAGEVGRQTRSTVDIQRMLHLNEEEATEFFKMMGQLHGTADRISGMMKESRRVAGQTGMNIRQVAETLREFEDVGRTAAIGQTRAREVGVGYLESMRAQQQSGIMTRQQLMRYGGQTEEEALRIQATMRFRRGIQMYEEGRFGGMGMLMTQNRGAFMRFMGGRMGPMEMAGAVGETMARDPWAFGTARYDPQSRVIAGRVGELSMFQETMAAKRAGYFIGGGNETEMIQDFQRRTGFDDMTAADEFRKLIREQRHFGRLARDRNFEGDSKQHGQAIQGIYHRLRAEGLTGFARDLTGGDLLGSAATIYGWATDDGKTPMPADKSLEDILRGRAVTTARRSPADVARAMLASGGGGRFRQMAIGMAGRLSDLDKRDWIRGATFEERAAGMERGWQRGARALRTGDLAGAIRGFVDPLAQLGAGMETITGALLGEEGVGEYGLRMPVGPGGGANDILQVGINKEGQFRLQLQGREEYLLKATTIQQAERGIEEYLSSVGLKNYGADISQRLFTRLGRRMGDLDQGGLAELVGKMRRNRKITTRERVALNRLVFGRYKGLAGTIFGDEGAPTSLSGLAAKMANIAEGSAEWEMLGDKGLYETQQFASAYQKRGGNWTLERGLKGIEDMFGGTELAIQAVSDAVTGAGFTMDIGAIRTAFGGGEGRDELTGMLRRGGVVNQILDQMLKAGNAEKLADPIGSGTRPAHVRPEGTTWEKLLKKIKEG